MKKLLTVCAACMVASLASAAVESQNIVGYNTVTLDKTWTIMAVNFTGVGNPELGLNDAVPYSDGMTKGNTTSTADVLQIQTAVGYDVYYMSNGLDAKSGPVSGLEGKWAAAATYTPTTDTVPSGTAMWYGAKTPSVALKATVSGEVLNTDTSVMSVDLSVKQIANPYSVDLPLNDGIPYTVGMTKGNTTSSADTIQIQTAVGYDTYYMSNGLDAKSGPVTGLDGKWAAAATYTPTDASIPIGMGAWYLRKGVTDFDVTITRPYTL